MKQLKNIFLEQELDKRATTEKISVVQKEGNREVKRNVEFYNLDATQFRIWANNVLKDYIIKGFKIDKKRMKNGPKFGKD